MLAASDPVTWRIRRVAVAGVTGAGKTTLAGRISRVLDIPHTELDSLFHGPNWQPRPAFEADVERLTSGEAWVTEWQYSSARQIIAERADTLVWLDLPSRVPLLRVLRRTLVRRIHRAELWNGNVEPPLRTVLTDRDHILRWALRTRGKMRTMVPTVEAELPALRVVRLTSQREVDRWVAALTDARDGA